MISALSADSVTAQYARALTDQVSISGVRSGVVMSATDARCRIVAYSPDEWGGTIMQGDQKVIVLKADLDDAGLAPQAGDKLTIGGRVLTARYCDSNTRKIGTETIAYEIQARG